MKLFLYFNSREIFLHFRYFVENRPTRTRICIFMSKSSIFRLSFNCATDRDLTDIQTHRLFKISYKNHVIIVQSYPPVSRNRLILKLGWNSFLLKIFLSIWKITDQMVPFYLNIVDYNFVLKAFFVFKFKFVFPNSLIGFRVENSDQW